MQFDLVSAASGFLAGAITGATGTYLADRFTDQRRRQEAKAEGDSVFRDSEREMPELFAVIRSMLQERATIRDIGVTASGAITFIEPPLYTKEVRLTSGPASGLLPILENRGYVHDVRIGNCPTYRMSEEFVAQLNQGRGRVKR